MKDRKDYARVLKEFGLTQADMDLAARHAMYVKTQCAWLRVGPSRIQGQGVMTQTTFGTGDVIAPAMIKGHWTTFGRYANHAVEPTARFRQAVGADQMNLVAARPLLAGEEVTISYREARNAIENLKAKHHG